MGRYGLTEDTLLSMSRPELDARIDALNQLHGAKPKQKTDTKRTRVRSRRQKNKKRG